MKSLLLFFILGLAVSDSVLATEAPKGVLPEIRLNGNDEDKNQVKALQTEVMISKTENEAIASLKKIIEKRKGHSDEASLWNRLAELYMRRAKSGRFFDLYRESDAAVKFVVPQIRGQSASQYLREAVAIYEKIEKQWGQFEDLDSVLFNSAFAHQQLNSMNIAQEKYFKLINKFPDSPLVPDAQLAVGEMNYDAHRFNVALEHFQAIEKFPKARVFSYGLYKSAWTMYNLKMNEKAIDQLIKVVKYFDPNQPNSTKVNHNLRLEAIRDLGLFFGDVYPAEKAYSFFSEICTLEEIGDAMISLAKLYQGHSRDKEVMAFLPDFIAHQPKSSSRITAELVLAESYEVTKTRNKVIERLELVSGLCEKDSEYRALNQKSVAQTCDMDFPKANIEYAKKWWDLWQKNKQNKEIVGLTLKAFEIHLRHDDPLKPDTKSRYAFAELLYQMEDYAKASEQYEKVSDLAVDTMILHDSSYAALVSIEKSKNVDKLNLIRLSEKYLSKNPNGVHVTQVKFKIGFTYYELKKFDKAEFWLKPLALTMPKQKSDLEFKRKSEDLELDILNARKDYLQIAGLVSELLKEKLEPARKLELTKIIEEAKFAQIQVELNSSKDDGLKWGVAQKLLAFSKEHPDSTLSKEALWQSLSLAFVSGHVIAAADLSLNYVQLYPNDPRNKDTLKEAAKTYADNALFPQALGVLKKLSGMSEGKDRIQLIEATADVHLLLGQDELARQEYSKLLDDKSKENQSKVYSQILATFKGKENSQEYHNIENKILSAGVEPYYSLLQVKLSENLLQNRKWVEAFNSTKLLINSNGSSEARARAHLVRGRVLEEELANQSLKTSLERLSVVLALKTEKLDKAQQAYSLAEKLAEKPETQLKALNGLSRSYQNYISSVSSPALKTELSPEESKALQTELAKILKPVNERHDEIQKRIQKVTVSIAQLENHNSLYLTTPASESIKPDGNLSSGQNLKSFIPEEFFVNKGQSWSAFEAGRSQSCNPTSDDLQKDYASLLKLAKICASKHSPAGLQKLAEQMLRMDSKDPQGLFYMAQAAAENNEPQKAIWIFDLAIKKSPENPVLHYNKGRELLLVNQSGLANQEFRLASAKGLVTPELKLVSALDDFSKGDCLSSVEKMNDLSLEEVAQFHAIPVLAECSSIKGDPDKGIQILKKQLKANSKQSELWLELGRLEETFKFEKQEAIVAYQNAAQYSTNADLKDWVRRKVEYLSGNVSVTVLNTQHVDSRDRDSGTIGGP